VLQEISSTPAIPRPRDRPGLAEDIGATRASRGVHPTESLRAVAELFEVALPVIVTERLGESPDSVAAVDAAIDLHRTMMDRVIRASVPYVDYLLGKVSSSHREERNRLARELHDRAAHAVGVGLQSLELHRVYAAADPDRAGEKLDAAWQALHEAMQTIREMAGELRESVGVGGLPRAILSYLQANAPPDLDVGFSVEGDLSRLPADVSDELYLVLREAVRNALLHGRARSVRVRLAADGGELRAEVADDGIGFDPRTAAGVGVASMGERMQLLGGTLTVTSAPGRGTGVQTRLPLPRPAP
jgi:signal transduction histidine kinase